MKPITEKRLVLVLLALVILGLMYIPERFHQTSVLSNHEKAYSAATPTTKKVTFPLDINTANEEELQLIPGIGPVKARSIVDYRESNGGFSSVEELVKVSGIGEKTLEKMRKYVVVKGMRSTEKAAETDRTNHTDSNTNSVEPKKGLLNVNTASQEELEGLPGIGPVKAKAIIEFREENGPFETVEDLVKVSGIGEKTLEKIRPYVTVGEGSGKR